MPIQRRTINIGSVLGTLAQESSETFDVPLASGFSEGESVMKKRKMGEEEAEVTREQQAPIQTEPSVTKSPPKKGKVKIIELSKRPLVTYHINVNVKKNYRRLGSASFTWMADL